MPAKVSIDRLVATGRDQHYKLIMFLSRDQIEDLTDAKRRSKQLKVLNDMGIRFKRTHAGWPKVLQAEVERVMLGGSIVKTQEPDFDAING
jgi:hypothetical protein